MATPRKNPEDKLPVGRKTDYRPAFNTQAYKLCLLGATNEKMAEFFEVAESTFYKWMVDYPKFSEAIKRGRVQADAEIANSLYQRAKGYKHKDVHISNYQGEITITPIVKHYPPDTGAAFIWLKNRAGWKDKQEHTLGDPDGNPLELIVNFVSPQPKAPTDGESGV